VTRCVRQLRLVAAIVGVVAVPALAQSAAPAAPRIVNGDLTAAFPSVAAVLVPASPASGGTWCSGTLIGCQTVLTAAHCVCDALGAQCQSGVQAPDPADFGVFLQHAGFFSVASIAVHPDFDFPVADVALLTLASPVDGIRPTPINATASPAFGTAGLIAGFGRSGGGSFDYGLKRFGAVETTSCPAGISNATSVCWDFADPIGPPGDDSNTCNADSGGPLFVDFGSGPVVAGITSGGTSASCTPLDHSYDANVFTYQAYIAASGGADLSNTACGTGPQALDPGASVTGFDGVLSGAQAGVDHTVVVPAMAERLVVTMNASEALGNDFDLYVKHGGPASPVDFDCAANGSGQYGACVIAAPAAGTWWVRIARFSGSGTYQATATVFESGCAAGSGNPCDDGNPCTEGDVCGASGCAGTPVADGTPCDDGRSCTWQDACSAGTCLGVETPRTTCKTPIAAKASVLSVRDATNPNGDTVQWTWRRGEATSPADLGDPTAGDPVAFCLYDETAGTPALVLELQVAAPALWKAAGSSGFRFRDRTRAHGGADSILLRSGPAGRATVTFKARGPLLDLPALPLAQDGAVIAQVVTPAACFGATFSTAQANTATRMRARSD
jgi:Trypsin/Bacterial pre-peptidase C-terminal domain